MNSIWERLEETFDSTLPRMNAAYVKDGQDSLCFAYPAEDGSIGWCIDENSRTGYDQPPKFQIRFGVYESPGISAPLHRNRPLVEKMMRRPGQVRRWFEFTNLGLIGTDRIDGKPDGGIRWKLRLKSRAEQMRIQKTLYTVLSAQQPFRAEQQGGLITLRFADSAYSIASDSLRMVGVFSSEREMEHFLTDGIPGPDQDGVLLALASRIELEPGKEARLTAGMSCADASAACAALTWEDADSQLAAYWDGWFSGLPRPALEQESAEEKAYYKCWQTIRENYYQHPAWGHCVTEALPVYKGIWQWALPSVEWHSSQNTEHTGEWFRKAMDLMTQTQREDGYITHAIYIDDKIPGERWLKGQVVQMPHLPWAALRYWSACGDRESLARWYPHLVRYYQYLCKSRDEAFENRHLWAITTSFDSGLDTFPAFQEVTYGVDGKEPEPYCYPACFGAERYRYEQAMARLAQILSRPEADTWRGRAHRTRDALEYLWDPQQNWYGVRHADGRLDTRVGVDGLFPLVYQMADAQRVSLMRGNFERLLCKYGVRTCAPDAPGYRGDVYWRGAVWPKSCSLGMEVCRTCYPELMDRARRGVIRFANAYPNIWECIDSDTGKLGRSDHGFVCTPGISSNVGASDIIGAIFLSHGIEMYGLEWALPITELHDIHVAGMRIDIARDKTGAWILTARAAERDEGEVLLTNPAGEQMRLPVRVGEHVVIPI